MGHRFAAKVVQRMHDVGQASCTLLSFVVEHLSVVHWLCLMVEDRATLESDLSATASPV